MLPYSFLHYICTAQTCKRFSHSSMTATILRIQSCSVVHWDVWVLEVRYSTDPVRVTKREHARPCHIRHIQRLLPIGSDCVLSCHTHSLPRSRLAGLCNTTWAEKHIPQNNWLELQKINVKNFAVTSMNSRRVSRMDNTVSLSKGKSINLTIFCCLHKQGA
jgi:hypothetical protein